MGTSHVAVPGREHRPVCAIDPRELAADWRPPADDRASKRR
ncbi:MAG TPA: hypothetical protein VMN39_04430 [Longimicrobiaceae bacterium]|nr:hypothetical protein [Longimicrobiaceae bacterium]